MSARLSKEMGNDNNIIHVSFRIFFFLLTVVEYFIVVLVC
jgi:hypothetical protein